MSRDVALLVFESSRWRDLRPLTDLVPTPDLVFGASTLAERWRRAAGLPFLGVRARGDVLATRAIATADAEAAGRAHVLAVDATALPGDWLARALEASAPARFTSGGAVVAARVEARDLAAHAEHDLDRAFASLPAIEVDARRIAYPWDLMAWNAGAIAADLDGAAAARDGEVHPQAVLLAPERIAVRAGATVEALAVLDARPGPILISEGASVAPHTTVTGPCVVGPRTQLLGGFVSRTTFGPECRIAGEVEECVWQGYGNKRHHGFVGHSAIGEWVNLGALTTTSDLKNNYGEVRVWIDGRERASGTNKAGAFLGAHVKTGIGSLLPTGACVGVGANLFGGGRFAPKDVAAFAWWDGERTIEHQFDKFLATARVAMSRRGRELGAADERLLRRVFEATAPERARATAPSGAR